ncbi:hypothetical protein, partial [Escherichia coli]|uniref:hypothetical protein n=1 Tax=Escherichia coli TaxID=562 RepID=UPI001BB47803
LSSGEYLPGSLQGKISSDSCLKKEQMVVSAIVSTPHIHNGVSHAPEDVGHANKDNLSSTFKQMRTKEEK